MRKTDETLIEAVENVRAAKRLVPLALELDSDLAARFDARTSEVARTFGIGHTQASAAILEAAFNCHISKESIVECLNGDEREGLAFYDGRLVHYKNNRVVKVTLKQSVRVWEKLERDAAKWPDGGHIPEARAKWFKMLANAIR